MTGAAPRFAPAGRSLEGRTLVVSGGSRGIGLAIALRAAQDGANVVLLAKTDTPHARVPGTVHTAADEIRAAGGRVLPIVGDVRDDDAIRRAVDAAVAEFGGIDVCLNNASVLNLAGTLELDPKRYDLMQDVNTRGTFQLTRACLPHLLESTNPHVLTLSPPINLTSRYWLARFPGYLLAKYGMTIATLAIGAEFADRGVGANALWPETTIATAAVGNLLGGEAGLQHSRDPGILADAAYAVLTRDAATCTGNTFIDVEVLAAEGVDDFAGYTHVPGTTRFDDDFFLVDPAPESAAAQGAER